MEHVVRFFYLPRAALSESGAEVRKSAPRSARCVEQRSMGVDGSALRVSTKRKTLLGERFGGKRTVADTMGTVSSACDRASLRTPGQLHARTPQARPGREV